MGFLAGFGGLFGGLWGFLKGFGGFWGFLVGFGGIWGCFVVGSEKKKKRLFLLDLFDSFPDKRFFFCKQQLACGWVLGFRFGAFWWVSVGFGGVLWWVRPLASTQKCSV